MHEVVFIFNKQHKVSTVTDKKLLTYVTSNFCYCFDVCNLKFLFLFWCIQLGMFCYCFDVYNLKSLLLFWCIQLGMFVTVLTYTTWNVCYYFDAYNLKCFLVFWCCCKALGVPPSYTVWHLSEKIATLQFLPHLAGRPNSLTLIIAQTDISYLSQK